jgi:hypothetical protein
MIAMQKPNAIITNKARIFLLEMFLTALVMTPKFFTFQACKWATKKGMERNVLLLAIYPSLKNEVMTLFFSIATAFFPSWLTR